MEGVFSPHDGRFGELIVGAPLPRELEYRMNAQAGGLVSRVQLDEHIDVYVRADKTIDAIGAVQGYGATILDVFRIGDRISQLFAGDRETPKFEGVFVEIASSALYFKLPRGLALSVHVVGSHVEYGPYSDEDWSEVLGARVGSVFVMRHAEKLMAY
jgi:hypothetical protein